MTKEELDALMITEKDLICVIFCQNQKVVGSLSAKYQGDLYGIHPAPPGESTIEGLSFCLEFVKSIEIIKKDFWNE